MLEMRLLGQFDVRVDGEPVAIPSRPAQSLLAYLVLNTGVAHRREKLAGMLWPDSEEANARSNLRHALWRIQKAIGDDFIETGRVTITFLADADYWVDVSVLEQRMSGGALADEVIDTVALYEGELLPGFYDDWTVLERERLQAIFGRWMQFLLECLVDEQRWGDVLQWGEHWIALGQVPEPAYRMLMVAHSALGDVSSVGAIYRRCVEALEEELGVEPSAETQALYNRLSSGEMPLDVPVAAPIPDGEPAPRHKLPAELTSFVGRTRELAEITALLDDPSCRLLTVVGPGGIGKTRLALKTAAQRMDDYAHGVYHVPLASLNSAEFLVASVADALDFSFYDASEPKEQLISYLHGKEILLVLDSFEHVLDGVGVLSEVLTRAPDVQMLATSRERLNIQAEYLYELGGMESPRHGQVVAFEDYEAVALFVACARRAQPGYALSGTDKPSVARICQLVGGMPLGIELAAAWVQVLSPEQIADEIERNLDFLATSMRDVPARHRSMRAVIDHSWSLISEAEQDVFKKLSVFRGGFTLEAATVITGASLITLAALVEKSLLARSPDGRFEVHELIRQYAAQRLGEEPSQEADARAAHWAYYAEFLHRLEPKLKGPRIAAGLDDIQGEIENIRIGWQWAVDQGRFEAMQEALISLWLFYSARGPVQEGREAFRRAAAALEAGGDGGRAVLLWQMLAAQTDFTFEAAHVALGRHTLEAIRHHQAQQDIGIFYTTLASSAPRFMEAGEAREVIEEAINAARRSSDPWQLGATLFSAGHTFLYELDSPQRANEYLQEGVTILRDIDDRFWLSRTLTTLGDLAFKNGAYAQAYELFQDSLSMAEEMSDLGMAAWNSIMLGRVCAALGEYAQAQKLYDQNLANFRELGFPYMRNAALFSAAHFSTLVGDYAEAQKQLEASYRGAHDPDRPDRHIYYLIYKGGLAHAQCNYVEAKQHLDEALVKAEEVNHHVGMVLIRHLLGECARQMGDFDEAWQHYKEGLKMSLKTGFVPEVLKTLLGITALLESTGQPGRAVELIGLILRHRAIDFAMADQAYAMLMECEGNLSPEDLTAAQARGGDLELDEVIAELLAGM